MDIIPYSEVLGLNSNVDVNELFFNTIVGTNKTYDFFVDWDKINKKIHDYKLELNILNSLIGSKDFDADLSEILKRYPEVIPVIPILIAIRDKKIRIIKDLSSTETIAEHVFIKKELTTLEIQEFILFFEKTGLKNFFINLSQKSIIDYVTGIEVGLDTNARKSRSGYVMEGYIDNILILAQNQSNIQFDYVKQKKFSFLKKYNIDISSEIKNRKADFILFNTSKSKIINIEVNFYNVAGSKPQEIVDSYINRKRELKNNGIEFIWVTDGNGIKKQRNQILKGFDKIDYILNIDFVKKGLLTAILNKIFES